ncbi:MAG TPA: MBL fold metallo-hydrolase [Actinomycetes bacterium]|nr:MBL fold metallo-hydrolase [Actinomycetes bacterium]
MDGVEVFVTAGLGDNSYLVCSQGEAAVVDPQRDAWRFLRAAEAGGTRIRAVLETHVHNDYVSGAHELRAATGAELVVPAEGRYQFPHRPAADGHQVRIGELRLVALATPGHTPEHLAWLLYQGDAATPRAVLTGGSLLVGSAGRTDLLGPELAGELTQAQFATIRKLAALPDEVEVLPTHGAGSFCVAAMPATRRTSTIALERRENTLFRAADLASFDEELRGELLAYPAYYRHMAPINRAGAEVLGGLPRVPAVGPGELAARVCAGAVIVDGRERDDFAAAHIPGSVNVELNAGFASYTGWLLPFDKPLLLVLPDPGERALEEAVTQLIRIGWRHVEGWLAGGVDAWRASGGELRSYPCGGVKELCDAFLGGQAPRVLDVRQELEWQWGGIPDSERVFLADLPARLDRLSRDEVHWVVCSNGHRASIAASLLDRAGVPVRLVGTGGVAEWRTRCRPALAPAG